MIGFFVALACTPEAEPPAATQFGSEDSCDELLLDPNESSELGFSAVQLLDSVGGQRTVMLTWAPDREDPQAALALQPLDSYSASMACDGEGPLRFPAALHWSSTSIEATLQVIVATSAVASADVTLSGLPLVLLGDLFQASSDDSELEVSLSGTFSADATEGGLTVVDSVGLVSDEVLWLE